jgi:hypothetical protein
MCEELIKIPNHHMEGLIKTGKLSDFPQVSSSYGIIVRSNGLGVKQSE